VVLMATRSRILAYGTAGMLVLAGVLCALLVNGITGQVLTIVLLSLGLGGLVLLVFLEIGLSEERDLAREHDERQRELGASVPKRRRRPPRIRTPRRPR
jgi:hypothetical protein